MLNAFSNTLWIRCKVFSCWTRDTDLTDLCDRSQAQKQSSPFSHRIKLGCHVSQMSNKWATIPPPDSAIVFNCKVVTRQTKAFSLQQPRWPGQKVPPCSTGTHANKDTCRLCTETTVNHRTVMAIFFNLCFMPLPSALPEFYNWIIFSLRHSSKCILNRNMN